MCVYVQALTLKAQEPPSAAETPSIANTMLIGMVASAIVLELNNTEEFIHDRVRIHVVYITLPAGWGGDR